MDHWTNDGKVALEDDLMTVSAADENLRRSFRLETAVRFLTVSGGEDESLFVGKVKSVGELASVGAEHYGTSVILRDTAYECEEGFIGTPTDARPASGSGLLHLR